MGLKYRNQGIINVPVSVRLSRPSGGSDPFVIQVVDENASVVIGEITLGVEAFANLMSSRVATGDGEFYATTLDRIGKKHEHKTVVVSFPTEAIRGKKSPQLIADALAEHEADGWVADTDDLGNPHKGGSKGDRWEQRVIFRRWV
jgi:hypothetical protein